MANMHNNDITLKRVLEQKQLKKLSDLALERELGLPKRTVNNWKRGLSETYLKMLPELSCYFNVSVDYLLGKTQNPQPPDKEIKKTASEELGDDIMQLFIDAGRIKPGETLTPEQREYATELVRAALSEKSENKR